MPKSIRGARTAADNSGTLTAMEAEIDIPDWATRIASDYTDMDRSPRRVDSSKVSSFRLTLPDDVYFEYAFIDQDGQMRLDPANPVEGANPWYREVSAIVGPTYRASHYAGLAGEATVGTLDRHRLESEVLGDARRAVVFTPHGAEDAALPLILVFDGTAFLRLAGLPQVLEALLAKGEASPARLVFIEPDDRTSEYGFNGDYRRFILEELLPFLTRHYPVSSELYLMGASLGGLMSATFALLNPGRISGLATFSGAFLGTPQERDFYRAEDSWVLQRLREEPPESLRWYAEVGTIEWLTTVNRELHDLLEGLTIDHAYRERNAGHNWTNWRNGLADALRFLLPA